MPRTVGDLHVEQDLEFQRREWSFQRVGRIALFIFLAAAAVGVFGSGPLSHARAGESGSRLWVDYDRFPRRGAPDRLVIHVGPMAAEAGLREIRLERAYVDRIQVQRITPEPDSIVEDPTDMRLIYDARGMQSGATVTVDFLPLSAGRQTTNIQADGPQTVSLAQFVYF